MNQRFVIIIMLFLGVIFGRETYGHSPVKTTNRSSQFIECNASSLSEALSLNPTNPNRINSKVDLFIPGEEPKDSTILISDCGGVCPLATTTTLDGGTYPSAVTLGYDFHVGCQGVFEAPRRNQVLDICGFTVKLRLLSLVHGTNGCSKTITFVWEVSDDCGNIQIEDQVFTIVDDIAPVITPTAATTYNVSCGTMVPRPTAEDECQGALLLRLGTPNTSSVRGLYYSDATMFSIFCANSTTIIRTWVAADGCGNLSAPFVQTINYNDTSGPTFTVPANVTTDQGLDCSNDDDFDPQFLASLNASWGFPTNVIDDCQGSESSLSANYVNGNNTWTTAGGYTISFSDNTPCVDPDYCTTANGFKLRYKIERTWTIADQCGNVSTPVVQTINITDNTPPVITGSTNLGTVIINSAGGSCPNDVVAFSQSSNAPDPQATFHYDGTNLLVTDPGSGVLVGTFAPPSAADMCNGIGTTVCPNDVVLSIRSAVVNDKSNAPCQVRYAVLWEAEDACGNKTPIGNPFRQFITFSDELAPQWALAAGSLDQTLDCTNNIEPTVLGNGGAGLAPGLTDLNETCGITANYQLVSMIPSMGTAQGFYFLDGTVSNCAANEKVLTRTWYAIDTCGNISLPFVQTITIQDNSTPDFIQPTSPINLFTSTGNICPDGNDPEGMISLTEGQTVTSGMAFTVAGVAFNAPVFSITPTAAGQYGGLCDANTVLVLDDINVVGTMADCGFDLELVWKVTDDCGNTISRTQVFSVQDNTAPTRTTPGLITHTINSSLDACPKDFVAANFSYDNSTHELVVTDPNSGTQTRYTGIPVFADNCQSAINISMNVTNTNIRNCNSDFVLTWSANDGCGNAAANFDQVVRVNETVRPTSGTLSSNDIATACISSVSPSFFNYSYDPASGDGILTYDDGSGPVNLTGVGSAHFNENCEIQNISLVGTPAVVSQNICNAVYALSYSAQDSCNNSTLAAEYHTQTITISDNEGPTFTSFPSDDATLECMPDTSFYMSFITAVDNCAGTPVNLIKVTDVVTSPGTSCGLDPIVVERTYTVEDICGNTKDSTQMLVISDDQAPILVDTIADMTTCPGIPAPDYSLITAHDGNSCVSNLTITHTDVIIQNGTACLGDPRVTERTFRVEDTCGNFSVFVQTITEIDDEAPTFTPPADETFYYDENCFASPGITFPTNVSDNCGSPSVFFLDAFGSNPVNQDFIINRTWHISDGCFSLSHTQVVTTTDTISPTIMVASEVVTCDNVNLAAWLNSPTVADNCNVVHASHNYLGFAPTCGSSGVYTYEFFAIDDNGNTSTPVIRTYTVLDNTGPTFNNMPANITVSCGSSIEPSDLNGFATITDGCDPAPHIEYDDSRSFPGCPGFIEVITRTWTASDHCGNETTYTQTINIEDDGAPVITCPAAITIACDDTPSFSFTGQATATDNCQGIITPSFADVSVTTDCIVTITRTWTATDSCGNASSCTQQILLEDNESPVVLNPPSTMTVECDGSGNTTQRYDWIDDFGGAVVTDDCGTIEIWEVLDSSQSKSAIKCEECFGYTFYAWDGCSSDTILVGEASFCIEDTTAPAFDTLATDKIVECDGAGNLTELADWLSDNGGAKATETCSEIIWDNEIINTASSCAATSILTYQFSAKDSCGHEILTTADFIIMDNTVPTWVNEPVDTVVNCDGNGNAADLTAWLDKWSNIANAKDTCGTVMIIADLKETINPDSCLGQATYEYQFIAEDECGNKNARTVYFKVLDIDGPTITCPANMVVDCLDDSSPNALGFATGVDACSFSNSATFVDSLVLKPCPNVENIYRKWTVMDACGNASTCQQIIERRDTEAPIFTSQPTSVVNEYISDAFGGCHEQIDFGSVNNPNGNCWEVTFDVEDADGNVLGSLVYPGPCVVDDCSTVFPFLTVNRASVDDCSRTLGLLWTFTDSCSNQITFNQTYNFYDQAAPEWTVPNPYLISGICTDDINALLAANMPTIEDNCGGIITEMNRDIIDAGCIQTHIVNYQAMDSCGNVNQTLLQVRIDISDTEDPVWATTLPNNDMKVECDGSGNAGQLDAWLTLWENINNATDGCSDIEIESDLENYLPGNCGGTGVWTYVFVATDECGNSSAQTANFTIEDTTMPTFSLCPPMATVDCAADTDPGALGWATAADNCNTLANVFYNDAITTGTCPDPIETITRTWTATDACGNTNTCEQVIERVDVEAPMLTSQPTSIINEYISNAFGGCHEQIEFGSVSNPTGNCWEVTFDVEDVDGNVLGSLVYPGPCVEDDCSNITPFLTVNKVSVDNCSRVLGLLWSFTDDCNNEVRFDQTYNFYDQAAPQWTVSNPLNINGTCTDDIDVLLASNMPTIEDNCGGIITETNRDTIDAGCIQTHVVTYQTMDSCGNVNPTLLQVRIDISDTDAPVWATTLPSNDMKVECDGSGNAGQLGAWVTLWENQNNASDGCGDIEIVADLEDYFPGSCNGTGVWVYEFVATDDCGNSSSQTGTFTIEDSTKPTFSSCPPMATVDCGDNIDPGSLGWATATDLCSSLTNVIYNDASVSAICPDPIETITRTWTATDACGNIETCQQLIQVIDNEQPIIINGADDELIVLTSLNGACNGISTGAGTPGIHVDYSGLDGTQCSKIVFNGYDTNGDLFQTWNIDGPCAIDDCASIDFNAAITPSINGCMTVFAVVWTITDACGNTIQDTQNITFRDGVTPTWTGATSVVVNSDCSQSINDIILNNRPTALDNCSVIYNTVSDVTTNQGTCPGVYTRTITYSISDDCGNTNPTNGTLVINLNDTAAPIFTTAPRDTAFTCGTIDVLSELVKWRENMAGAVISDNCGNATLSYEIDYGLDFCGGADEFKYWFIAEDECGNRDSMTAFFRTIDTIAPVIIVQPQNLTVACDGIGNVTALNDWLENGAGAHAVDECWFKVSWDHRLINTNATSCSEAEYTYEIIALDDCGNSDTTTAVFTVVDNSAPIFVNAPADTTIACSANVPSAANVTAVDCDTNLGMSMTENVTPVNAGGIKELITRVWVAVDCHGRVTNHTQVITVQSGTGPATVYCPLDPGPFTSPDGSCVPATWTAPVFSGSNVTMTSTHSPGDCFDVGFTTVTYTATDDCGGTTTCSFVVEVTAACQPVANPNTQNFIDRVAINSITNHSGNDNGYGNYKNMSTTLFTGTNYFITLNPGGPAGTGINAAGFWRVWIDWNGDGVFSEPGERVAQAAGQGLMIANINIPSFPVLGTKCMRVSFNHFNYPQPCDGMVNGHGEVEDYTIHVINSTLMQDNPSEKETIVAENVTIGNHGFIAKSNGKLVDLNWIVAENGVVDYFNIERSKDGVNFSKLLTINSLESTSGELFYKAKDKKPLIGTNYYRLIQILKNGEMITSEIQKVIFEDLAFHVELYPNPTDGMLQIRQTDFVGKAVNVSIVNNLAQQVHDFKFEKMEPTTTIDLMDLLNGVYNVIIQSGEHVTVKQVIIQK